MFRRLARFVVTAGAIGGTAIGFTVGVVGSSDVLELAVVAGLAIAIAAGIVGTSTGLVIACFFWLLDWLWGEPEQLEVGAEADYHDLPFARPLRDL
jgi:hypothetical protein